MPATFELSSLDGSNGFVINGRSAEDNAGFSVDAAGDINGDGIDDLIIGAPDATVDGYDQAGESYVVFGNKIGFPASFELGALNGTNGFALSGIAEGDESGGAVSGAGDINGDGIDDLIIGASNAGPEGRSYAGESYVVFGSMSAFGPSLELGTLNGTNGFVINGINVNDGSGFSVSGAGDVNGDGIDDLIIGAPGANAGPLGYGRAGASYVVFGASSVFPASFELSDLDGTNGFVLNGVEFGDASGWAVSGAGDTNDDGVDDLIIGAPDAVRVLTRDNGEGYVVFGPKAAFPESIDLSDLDGTDGFKLSVSTADSLGNSVSDAGDINGDGIDDLIIGARRADPNGVDRAGRSFVVFGSESFSQPDLDLDTLDGSNGFIINGINERDFSGQSVSGAGDLNGDGFDDLLIGADLADPNGIYGAGQAYVVFGKAAGFGASLELSDLDGSNGFFINGFAEEEEVGFAVSGAGDVNADGLDDIIVASFRADPGGRPFAGQSYVIFGNRDFGTPPSAGESVVGTDGDETLTGTAGNDTVYGKGGEDLVTGAAGDDVLTGGFGNDTVDGEEGNDWLAGGPGDDLLTGGGGNDTLFGFHTDDVVGLYYPDVAGGSDTLIGGPGDDRLVARTVAQSDAPIAAEVIAEGGPGKDVVDVGIVGEVFLSEGSNQARASLSGGDDDDRLVFVSSGFFDNGTTVVGTMLGGAGDDVLRASFAHGGIEIASGRLIADGGDGADTITLEKGPTAIDGSGVATTITGGEGNDSIVIQEALGDGWVFDVSGDAGDDAVQISLDLGSVFSSRVIGRVTGGDGHDSLDIAASARGGNEGGSVFIDASGGVGDDVINATSRAGGGFFEFADNTAHNMINGGSGNDTITAIAYADETSDAQVGDPSNTVARNEVYGGEGHDRIHVTAEIDALEGRAAESFVNGGAGNDTLEGSDTAVDSLYGGDGDDEARGAGDDDIISGGAGNDLL